MGIGVDMAAVLKGNGDIVEELLNEEMMVLLRPRVVTFAPLGNKFVTNVAKVVTATDDNLEDNRWNVSGDAVETVEKRFPIVDCVVGAAAGVVAVVVIFETIVTIAWIVVRTVVVVRLLGASVGM